jgi:hypothetical protein
LTLVIKMLFRRRAGSPGRKPGWFGDCPLRINELVEREANVGRVVGFFDAMIDVRNDRSPGTLLANAIRTRGPVRAAKDRPPQSKG